MITIKELNDYFSWLKDQAVDIIPTTLDNYIYYWETSYTVLFLDDTRSKSDSRQGVPVIEWLIDNKKIT